jgi:hypothetical protein
MNVVTCDLYRIKPGVLPPQTKTRTLYALPGRLPAFVDPSEWELLWHDAEPSPAVAAELQRRGYCAAVAA